MASDDSHPSPRDLHDYVAGRLNHGELKEIESHLADCLTCQDTLRGEVLHEDTVEGLLKSPAPELDFADEPDLGEAIDALRRWALGRTAHAEHETRDDFSLCAGGPFRLRDYELLSRLGSGGMGTVYEARHLKLGRLVAVKVLPSARTQDLAAIARFQREMLAAGGLDHPNIVRAFDAGEVDGKHFLVMELIDGMNLSDVLRVHGPLDVADACEIARQVAVGLEYAHSLGLIHRDIKPSNIMLSRSSSTNIVKILDLGLARILSQSATVDSDVSTMPTATPPTHATEELTHSHQLLGTPDYMAPEQCRPKSKNVDIRADIYSLGSTLYKLLSNTAPYSGPNYNTVAKKLHGLMHDPVPRLEERRPSLPLELVAIVHKMMHADPDKRFATPGEVAQELAVFTAGHNLSRLVVIDPQPEHQSPGATRSADIPRAASLAGPKAGLFYPLMVLGTLLAVGGLGLWQFGDAPRGSGASLPQGPLPPAVQGSQAGPAAPPIPKTPAADSVEAPAPQAAVAADAAANDVFYTANLEKLPFMASKEPQESISQLFDDQKRRTSDLWIWTYVVLDGPGEAFLSSPRYVRGGEPPVRIAIRAPQGAAVSGRIVVPESTDGPLLEIPFRLESDAFSGKHAEAFYRIKLDYYQFLVEARLPGAAWFRHQFRTAASHLPEAHDEPSDPAGRSTQETMWQDRTFDLLSGGLAVSENLKLDSLLPPESAADTTLVDTDSIQGVTVQAFDWTTMTRDLSPQLDPLSELIPADQHAFFFPSFASLSTTFDHLNNAGLTLLQWIQLEAERNDLLTRYQDQLGLQLGELSRLLGPQFIRSLAVTGGDPYFDTGTDIAILFEPSNLPGLSQLLEAQIALSAKQHATARPQAGQLGDTAYTGFVSPDRIICSYQATVGTTVVVSNSLVQLQRIVETAAGQTPNLMSAKEYQFFRHRYPMQPDASPGLMVISDETIRRWCSPRWRIGAARRLKAAAALMEMQSQWIDARIAQGTNAAEIPLGQFQELIGQTHILDQNVQSEHYGNLNFLTPIGELHLDQVTRSEERQYVRWRERYERAWRQAFDPIALQFDVTEKHFSADLSVMPLISNSQYSLIAALVGNANMDPSTSDPHADTLVHWTMGIDKNSPLVGIGRNILAGQLPQQLRADPLAWMGKTISFYADADPYWTDTNSQQFNVFDMFRSQAPIGIHFDVENPLSLLPFLAALRAFIDQTGPGMTVWETFEHQGTAYVRIKPGPQLLAGRNQMVSEDHALYYAATARSLVFSPSEKVIHRAIERANKLSHPGESIAPELLDNARWLGQSVNLQLDGAWLPALQRIAAANFSQEMCRASWRNIPILNEWKRAFPDDEPQATHTAFFKRQLECPAGGEYFWDERRQSMVSSVCGPPGTDSQPELRLPLPYRDLKSAVFGLTFEQNGLRAKVLIHRQ